MQDTLHYADDVAIRTRLTEIGLAATLAEIDRMKRAHGIHAITRALDAARDNPRAQAFLDNLLLKVRGALSKIEPKAKFAPAHRKSESGPRAINMFSRKPTDPYPTLARPAAKKSLHIYGKTAALTIETGTSAKHTPVIFVEGASAKDGSYEWTNKITLMLSLFEMLSAVTVLLGDADRCAFDHHGPNHDKSIAIANQGANIYLTVRQGKTDLGVPISPADAYQFAALLLVQIRANTPHEAHADISALIFGTIARLGNDCKSKAHE